MKKYLYLGGVGLAVFGLYRYFKYQVDLALNYDYQLKDFRVLSYEGNNVTISAEFALTNRSTFQIQVVSYDLQLFYNGVQFASTASATPTTIMPAATFKVKGQGIINVDEAKTALLPFFNDVLNRRPINIQVSGNVKVVFLGIPYTMNFDKQAFNYSTDVLKEYKLDTSYEKLKAKYPKLFAMIGVK